MVELITIFQSQRYQRDCRKGWGLNSLKDIHEDEDQNHDCNKPRPSQLGLFIDSKSKKES